jgi:myo-inositol 2-dehydrogenase/D-chiro-inositol 1-dehydrogenase
LSVICLVGAGRIGAIHAANVAAHPTAELRYVTDINSEAAANLATRLGATVVPMQQALADEAVDAVLVASATHTHVDLITAAIAAGKAVFCEKPVDLDIQRVEQCLKAVGDSGYPLMLGFNRRFDPQFAALHQRLRAGEVGKLEVVSIVSRDPEPPPIAYLEQSGGLFLDMMIHDFDMARWLLNEEPCELYATASALVDPAVAAAGDVDTALVTLRTDTGVLCSISNSRRAVYGYDQRVEVFGSTGMLRAENETATRLQHYTAQGVVTENPLHFFLERYRDAYRFELAHFLNSLEAGTPPSVSGEDGLRAQRLAEAAARSCRDGKPVQLA